MISDAKGTCDADGQKLGERIYLWKCLLYTI